MNKKAPDLIKQESPGESTIRQWHIPSATGIGELALKAWLPQGDPQWILLLVHGMAEHIERYDAFARVMTARSALVVGFDLPGHGRSVPEKKYLGYFTEEEGYRKVVQDLHNVTQEARSLAPGRPIYLLGHSMGSFLTRLYAAEHGQVLSGLILSGTAGDNPMLPLGRFLAGRSFRRNGAFYRDPSIDRLMHQGYLSRVKAPVSAFDWLSRDADSVKAYEQDPLCGFLFTASGYRDMFGLLAAISGKKWASRVPSDLPILILSGEDDPVGGYGAGPKQVHETLKNTGHQDVSMILYQGGRHEILNEINKEAVYEDIAATVELWMGKGEKS